MSTHLDEWGSVIEAANVDTVESWNRAWTQALHFVGDPFEILAEANAADEGFVLGSVFCGTYRVLAGARPDDPALLADVERATGRAESATDRAHVDALTHLVAGNFTAAGERWDDSAVGRRDFAATRFAHDVYLHVGDDDRRLASSQRAFDSWGRDEPGWGLVAGQLSFALEEAGNYTDAEALGREALECDPADLWARHALAHVYESTNDSDGVFGLLLGDQEIWAAQDGLAVHIWWHVALRLIAEGRHEEALAIHDAQQAVATTPFRLCDLASILWRLELLGTDVGDRWDVLADRFGERSEWHTSGFLDMHGAFIYSRQPDHGAADRFFTGLTQSHSDGNAENDHTFTTVVKPLVAAIARGHHSPAEARAALDELSDRLHHIGGSHAQREIIEMTRTYYDQRARGAKHDDAKHDDPNKTDRETP